jgi:hypothetical protein
VEKLITRVCRAAMMGLAWGPLWVAATVVPISLIVDDLDPGHIGGPLYAGFICGALFSELAGIASGRRRLDALSPSRAAAWGAMSGLFVGVLPFVIGDNGRYQNAWSTAIVATSVIAARIAARWRKRREGSLAPLMTLVAIVSGLLAGVVPAILTSESSTPGLLPVAAIGGISGLSTLSALVSQAFARWATTQNAPANGHPLNS